MYKIEKKNYGVKLTFEGFIQKDAMEQWLIESKKMLPKLSGKFGVFVDMRALKPLPRDAQSIMEQGQMLFKKKGMERSVVILENSVLTMQFRRLAKQSGIAQWERYIDASDKRNWEILGVDWLQRGLDPDQR